MNPEDAQRDRKALEIFSRAVEMASAEARAGYLEGACGGDELLKARVVTLLASHVEDGFMQGPAASPGQGPTVVAPITERVGDRIGRYKLLQQIGEGGWGVVYMAEQEEPVRRRVALKVIKLGMDTKSVVARFEAERQALAMMDHPNIARVLDAGATDTGRPYFVMELVRGIRITDYCDQNHLPTEARLELFITVCRAVQHAHQKGIIHRDLKPSNILVTLHDGVPVPKVIDFGIAKATEQKLTEKTLFTELHQFIGTPAYMSPEQAEMSGLDIDTRSDIYSLGVLLYELLTGRTPFDARELLKEGFDAIRRTIREVEPVRPSTRLSTLAHADLDTVAKARGTGAVQLRSRLRGDLDWIVMKALEKDRTLRYDTAGSFALDIRRHLSEEPVSAVAPRASYRFGKFVRRNKTALSVTAALVILSGALAVSVVLLFNEWRAGKFGGITLNSSPEGAEVWREGKMIGTTPFKMAGLPIGEFTYSLVLRNYEPVTNTTSMVAKKQMNDFTFLRKAELSGTNAVPNASTNMQELAASAPQGATILSIEGSVEVARKDKTEWMPAQTNMLLSAGDRLRTDAKSRTMLRFWDLQVVRIGPRAIIRIEAPSTKTPDKPSLHLKEGQIELFRKDGSSNSPAISTPAARVGIRG